MNRTEFKQPFQFTVAVSGRFAAALLPRFNAWGDLENQPLLWYNFFIRNRS